MRVISSTLRARPSSGRSSSRVGQAGLLGSLLHSASGQALGLVPLLVGLLLGALALPRSVAPEAVPLPTIDARALAGAEDEDAVRAARVRGATLSSRVRAVGSGFRDFNLAEATHDDAATISRTRDEILAGLRGMGEADVEPLKDLRAFQMETFLVELRAYERTGTISKGLLELGGTFVESMTKVGWCDHHHVAMPDAARRVAFKLTWNHTLLLESDRRFAVTTDENRALYSFYLSHPHVPETQHARLEAGLRGAPDAAACERAAAAEESATASWLLGKVNELSQIDPGYPAALARAAILYWKRDFRGSATLYEGWLEAHPSGPWTLRAENHLRAALLAAESSIQ